MRDLRTPKRLSVQAWVNVLGEAINESCKMLGCKKADHRHQPKFRLLPPRWEDQGRDAK